MSAPNYSEKDAAPPTSPSANSNKANDAEDKSTATAPTIERPAYLTENISGAHASPIARTQRIMRNDTGDLSPSLRVGWTAVRAHPSGQESFTTYLDDGAFLAAGSRPAPPPAPETVVSAASPTPRDEGLLEKGEKFGIHDGRGHGDLVDKVADKGKGKVKVEDKKNTVGGVESQDGKAAVKQKTVAGKKKFGSFNAILYGPPAGATDDQEE